MKIVAAVTIIALWFLAGFVSIGYGNASYIAMGPKCTVDGAPDSREDFAFNVFIGLFGPIALAANYISSGMGADGWTLEMEHCKGKRWTP